MNEEKLSSDKVPQKFAEWLLSMGCPPDKVPSVDKLAEMCRGQYYMVWRSLMEHVEAKDIIKQKRMQVFHNDIERCQKKNAFCKPDSSVVVPDELTLWKQQMTLKERVQDAETRVQQAREKLNLLVDKVSSKLSQRNASRSRLQDGQRRAWLLQQVAEELQAKKSNLIEAKGIADSLCKQEESGDVESKLDKLLNRRTASRPAALSVSMASLASSSITSNTELNDTEEQLSALCTSGGSLWGPLCRRRAALPAALAADTPPPAATNRVTPQWVLSHTAALQCTLSLEAVKCKLHAQHTQRKLAAELTQLNECLSGSACELLVVRSEVSRAQARVQALRDLHDQLAARSGPFAVDSLPLREQPAGRQLALLDKAIESKRDELKRLITSLAITERKIQNVRECLITVFNSFHSESAHNDTDRFGGQLCLPQESVMTLRRFYEERRDNNRNKMALSLDLDTSENCSYDAIDNANPTFIDELKVYLKKFQLEKNRKLILESGEKIWIFETLNSSIERLRDSWHRDDVTCSLICPSVNLSYNLKRLIEAVDKKEQLETKVAAMDGEQRNMLRIDVSSEIEEEQRTVDKIKKRLNENILCLQKTTKTLDMGQENLQLWSDNNIRKYISPNRTVDGKTFKEYEGYYIDSMNL
ncbi:uncharacterized protein LOC113494256 [Trichoplusia ni]|uniref:Uncharacterized protein LOC113494256 n=1 Tax=Trichoplusia ni TaxID=7111 RepID=A0A7E5VJD6_TRINI|nr:uncharacterized protein LOC113494256 [Trichoplusia ni]